MFSYGVMMYEIFSNGREPWNKIPTGEVKKKVVRGHCVQASFCCYFCLGMLFL